jgi:hypothetical protein
MKFDHNFVPILKFSQKADLGRNRIHDVVKDVPTNKNKKGKFVQKSADADL